MNQPHDPNVTSDYVFDEANTPRPEGRTTAGAERGTGKSTEHGPRTARPASGLPQVPGYRVHKEIARGGMGRVLAAYDLVLERDVALKVLLPGAHADRFVRESKITAQLPHPGIPPVYALGTLADGLPFLAMKLIAGQTLVEAMKTFDRPRLLQAFTQVCQAVGFAHSRGVVHRDLKPVNVMVGAFGEVQVMDWGLAKEMRTADCGVGIEKGQVNSQAAIANQQFEETQAGSVLGTPAYMAPEQARGEAVDARADVFSLGGILCAILTGDAPFRGNSSLEVVERARAADMSDSFARLHACAADVELVALCRRCLSPSNTDRPADGQAVADAMGGYLHGVQERLQAAERERAVALAREGEQWKRRWVQRALAATVAALLLSGVAFAWWRDRQATERRAELRDQELQANQGVDAALRLVPDLRRQYKFAAARQTLDQAAVLAQGSAPNRVAEIEQASSDLALVVALDDVRFRKWVWTEQGKGKFQVEECVPAYRAAFAERGLDLVALDPTVAAERLARSAVKEELVAALDDWALYETEGALRDRLLEVARRADPGPWPDRLRDPAVRTDRADLEALARSVDVTRTAPATLMVLADLMVRQGVNPVALIAQARAEHPANFELAFRHGQLQRDGKRGEALGPYEAARALRPENFAVLINLGNTLRDQGKLAEAIACYQKAVLLAPGIASAHNNLGLAYWMQGRWNEAIACHRQAIALDPKSAAGHNGLGQALHDRGQVDEAMASYHVALGLEPTLATAHYNLGNSFSRKGQIDESLACFQKAIEHDPLFAMAHVNLGIALYRKGREDEAIAAYRKAIAADPRLANAHYSLGLALAGRGQLDEASACYREAIHCQPDHPESHCNLGGLLRAQGDYATAVAMHRRGHELGSRRANWRYPSADWVAQAERELALSRRLPAVLRGEDLLTDNADRLTLARVALSQKQGSAATRLFTEALAADPQLANDRRNHYRYEAARAAALAAGSFSKEEFPLDDANREKHRRQALAWLQEDLGLWAKLLDFDSARMRSVVAETLRQWQQHEHLAPVRDPTALARLPEEERKAWMELWGEVRALQKKAEGAK